MFLSLRLRAVYILCRSFLLAVTGRARHLSAVDVPVAVMDAALAGEREKEAVSAVAAVVMAAIVVQMVPHRARDPWPGSAYGILETTGSGMPVGSPARDMGRRRKVKERAM